MASPKQLSLIRDSLPSHPIPQLPAVGAGPPIEKEGEKKSAIFGKKQGKKGGSGRGFACNLQLLLLPEEDEEEDLQALPWDVWSMGREKQARAFEIDISQARLCTPTRPGGLGYFTSRPPRVVFDKRLFLQSCLYIRIEL